MIMYIDVWYSCCSESWGPIGSTTFKSSRPTKYIVHVGVEPVGQCEYRSLCTWYMYLNEWPLSYACVESQPIQATLLVGTINAQLPLDRQQNPYPIASVLFPLDTLSNSKVLSVQYQVQYMRTCTLVQRSLFKTHVFAFLKGVKSL